VIGKLRAEFPSTQQKQEMLDQSFPGSTGYVPAFGPSSAPCRTEHLAVNSSRIRFESAVRDTWRSIVAVRNQTGTPLTLILPDGHLRTIGMGVWDNFELTSGESLKLLDGTCIRRTGHSALAVAPKKRQPA
jgi:hypothetical protein